MNATERRQSKLEHPHAITFSQSVSYVLPYISVMVLWAPIAIIQGIYAKYFGVPLTVLATIILLSRVFDAVSDPIVGYFSDRYRAKHGTRKPFIVAGSLLIILCGYFVYIPPDNVTTLYAGFWFIALFIAFTFFEIPHITWPCDITNNSEDKAKLYSFRVVANYCALVFFYCIPLLPFFESNAITPETLKVTYIVAAAFALPCVFQAIRKVPNGPPPLSVERSEKAFSWGLLRSALQEMVSNTPFVIFVLASLSSGLAIGLWYGLIFIYVDSYLGMGEQFAPLFLMSFFVGIVVTPLWYRLALKVGKKNVWLLATILLIFCFIFTGTLDPETATYSELLTLKVIQTCSFVCMDAIAPAILSEIIDYSRWKNRTENSAIYFSMRVFFQKTNLAIGVALGLAITGWYGFDLTVSDQTNEAVNGLKVAIAWIPALFGMITLVFIALSPIDERRHRIIARQLDARQTRATAKTISESVSPSSIAIN